MKKIFASTVLAIATFSMVADSFARPMGGRRSFGRQSTNVTRQAPPATPAPTAPAAAPGTAPAAGTAATAPAAARTPAPAPAQRPSMWKGVLGGALLGLGLGALFSSMGLSPALGNAIGSILMILLLVMAVMFIIRMFRRKDTPANRSFEAFNRPTPLHAGAGATPEIGSGLQPQAFQPVQQPGGTISVGSEAATWTIPEGFDKEGFLRHAKSQFIRMQAAWDKADVADLREFTTPEVFAELKMQIGERTTADYTDVVSIDAQLLGIENLGREWMASVKFTGMIKTAPDAQPEHFAEVWNLTKPTAGEGGWLLAGIQQIS